MVKSVHICKDHVYHGSLELQFYSSHFSMMTWAHTALSQKHAGWINNAFIKGLLHIIWWNVRWPFSSQLVASESHPQASISQSTFSQWGSSQDFGRPFQMADNFRFSEFGDNPLHYSIYFLWSTRSTGSNTAPQQNTTSTILDSRYCVLGVKGLAFSPLLVIVAKHLNFCCLWPQSFPPEGFFLLVHVISSKLPSSFKVPCLE